MERFKHKFYDSHPKLPLDPDSDQLKAVRPMHTDTSHIAVVALGAFFGTYARYEIGTLMPPTANEWPMATLLINVAGAFLLGFLLQTLFHGGNDEGGRRILRLMLGTGFLGAFTTYSSLATSVAVLTQHRHLAEAGLYAVSSVSLGIFAGALGIWVATTRHAQQKGKRL